MRSLLPSASALTSPSARAFPEFAQRKGFHIAIDGSFSGIGNLYSLDILSEQVADLLAAQIDVDGNSEVSFDRPRTLRLHELRLDPTRDLGIVCQYRW